MIWTPACFFLRGKENRERLIRECALSESANIEGESVTCRFFFSFLRALFSFLLPDISSIPDKTQGQFSSFLLCNVLHGVKNGVYRQLRPHKKGLLFLLHAARERIQPPQRTHHGITRRRVLGKQGVPATRGSSTCREKNILHMHVPRTYPGDPQTPADPHRRGLDTSERRRHLGNSPWASRRSAFSD